MDTARREPRKVVCAVATSILTAAYHMLKGGTAYRDLGPDHFDRRAREVQAPQPVRRPADHGYAVELAPPPPPDRSARFLASELSRSVFSGGGRLHEWPQSVPAR